MIKTLNPYANTAKTAEIMSRYRPIAPRPETGPTSPTSGGDAASSSSSGATSDKIRQSPYLRNLWPQMQARPTRTRKRGGRPTHALLSPPPPSLKRPRLISSASAPPPPPPQCHVAFMGYSRPQATTLVTLPLMPCHSAPSPQQPAAELDWLGQSQTSVDLRQEPIDLNRAAEIPEERDLLQQLQRTAPVIAPQPVRPVGSTISVRRIDRPNRLFPPPPAVAEEVEQQVEAEQAPAVISDSNNRVRVANSAYKELVGQPECPWLDSMVASKRIGGEVVLRLPESGQRVPSSGGFSCWVRIEWRSGNNEKKSVNAFCDVVRLACESKDYVFIWKFHIRKPSQSITN